MLGRPRTGILPHKMTGKIWEAIVQFTAQKHKFTKKLRFNYTTRECLPSSCTYHYVCYWCLVTKSCLTLYDPMDHSLPGSSVHGIFQARILEWVVISFSRGYSWPRDQSCIFCLVGIFFTTERPGKPPMLLKPCLPSSLYPAHYVWLARKKWQGIHTTGQNHSLKGQSIRSRLR